VAHLLLSGPTALLVDDSEPVELLYEDSAGPLERRLPLDVGVAA